MDRTGAQDSARTQTNPPTAAHEAAPGAAIRPSAESRMRAAARIFATGAVRATIHRYEQREQNSDARPGRPSPGLPASAVDQVAASDNAQYEAGNHARPKPR